MMHPEQIRPPADDVVLYRVICCDPAPLYEGTDEWAAKRHFRSASKRGGEEGHNPRMQKATVHWEDWR